MMKLKIFCFMGFLLLACGSSSPEARENISQELRLGDERTEHYFSKLSDKKIGLVANHTSYVGRTHLLDTLLSAGITVTKVFAPEHGFRGKASAGELIQDGLDSKTGVPIISLYGKNKKPSPEILKGLDMIVFDIQDVGARFYTYISTLSYLMEICSDFGIPILVLDRPNPHCHYIDGPILESEFSSFIGLHSVPVVYGMTIGEYAKMVKGERWIKGAENCKLEIIQCENYSRDKQFFLPIKPSPNLPNSLSVQLYPSLCFFEGTVLTAGRGTNLPFQIYGHPELKSANGELTPTANEGSQYPKFKGEKIKIRSFEDLDPAEIFTESKINITYLLEAYQQFENKEDFFLKTNFFEKLAGTKDFRIQVLEEKTETEIRESWAEGLRAFQLIRSKYLLY